MRWRPRRSTTPPRSLVERQREQAGVFGDPARAPRRACRSRAPPARRPGSPDPTPPLADADGSRATSQIAGNGQRDAEPDHGAGPLADQRRPTTTGTSAAPTPETGATTPIRPEDEAPVEERRPEPVAEPGQQRPGQVGAGRASPPAEQGDRQGASDAAALRDQGDRPGADPLRDHAAVEVAKPVRRRGQQRQQHRHVGTTPAIQTKRRDHAGDELDEDAQPDRPERVLGRRPGRVAPTRRCSAR